MIVDAYASLPHYADHLRPILDALPEDRRGLLWAPRGRWWGAPFTPDRPDYWLTLVASWRDAQDTGRRPLVYVEHGAGQTYDGDPRVAGGPSYAGAPELDRVRLFIAPGEHVAAKWRLRYPRTPVAVVGCPKLDPWHVGDDRAQLGDIARPTVAVTFHWQCGLVPETTSAWPHYDPVLPAVVGDPRWTVLGHGHPRLWGTIQRRWRALGVDHTPDFAEVLDRADLLVGDNTSALYEFASTGRPVVVVNAPAYRRHVHHGLRFWDLVPGLQVDTPGELRPAIAHALDDPPALAALRARAVAGVYAATDGRAARRAADAIQELS